VRVAAEVGAAGIIASLMSIAATPKSLLGLLGMSGPAAADAAASFLFFGRCGKHAARS
jgi:hypothetical protein